MTFPKPQKILVTPAKAALWKPSEFLMQEKVDGEFDTREIGGAVIAGDLLRRKSGGFLTLRQADILDRAGGEAFFAFDLLAMDGTDIQDYSARRRWQLLQGGNFGYPMVETCAGGTIPAGCEGVVAKPWASPYGQMYAVKQLLAFTCRVSSTGGTQSVGIVDVVTGQDRGRVTLSGGRCDKVRIGSLIRVCAMDLTQAGRLREPRVHDDFLIRF